MPPSPTSVSRSETRRFRQTPPGPCRKFYPDFVATLTDGRILAVEYKGRHIYEWEADKRHIGAAWADASGGRCLFCMPTNRDFGPIDRTIR